MSSLHHLKDKLLDASIYFSFDRSGYERHAEDFDDDALDVDLSDRRVLVTGANSGIGRAAALHLAHLGAEVWLLCRSEERGKEALDDMLFATDNEKLRLGLVDLADLSSIRDFVDRFRDQVGDEPVHALVHNAGVLPPERLESPDGFEQTWAVHVVGPHLLTYLLLPHLRAHNTLRRSRVVWVSSGGMYTQKLDLDDIHWQERDYDGVVAYAQTKRAQVVLAELWQETIEEEGSAADVVVHSMHPGWVETEAVKNALPRFWRLTKNRLRTPRQGADTIVWLAAADDDAIAEEGGRFFFDRAPRAKHPVPGTREEPGDREILWQLVQKQAGIET